MKNLIIYYSRNHENYLNGQIKNLEIGNTEIAANIIKELVKSDLFKIEQENEYSPNYSECIQQAKDDQLKNARPKLKSYPDNIDEYDNIYLGYPNYWSTMPMAVFTLLENIDFSNKTIHPFCTHEGGGMGKSMDDIKKTCPKALLKQGLAIHGADVKNSTETIKKWLEK